jgi:hypothetical protein
MGVCASYVKRTDPCAPGQQWGIPGAQRIINVKRGVIQVQVRIEPGKVEACRYIFVFESKDCLDESCDTCSGIEITDVGFY